MGQELSGGPRHQGGGKASDAEGEGDGPGPPSLPLNMINLYITYVVLIMNILRNCDYKPSMRFLQFYLR